MLKQLISYTNSYIVLTPFNNLSQLNKPIYPMFLVCLTK